MFNYDANDRFTAGDTYDNDGNTVSSGGVANVYDFENHLIQQGGVGIKYDGDGNRVFKTVAGVTTSYLLDDRSPTGYVQVLDEVQGGSITRSYVYGLELIEQGRINTTTLRQSTSYDLYDGHGSVRALTDLTGAVTDTYDYDAFGNIVHSTGTTPNNYLYSGEQYDPDLHLYYNRARYLNTTTGRFLTMDHYEGDIQSPLSLHKYLYAGSDPANHNDPSGRDFDIGSLSISAAVGTTIAGLSNVLVAAIFSGIFQGLPDAVGFGVYGSVGADGIAPEGIGGFEILFAPKLRKAAIYWFGGVEGEKDLLTDFEIPSLLNPPKPRKLFHGELGAFTAWYWNLKSLDADPVAILGASYGPALFAYEGSGPGKPQAVLIGLTLLSNDSGGAGLFAIGAQEGKLAEWGLSKGGMFAAIASADAALQAIGLYRFSASISVPGGVAGAILSAGAIGTWELYTYGK